LVDERQLSPPPAPVKASAPAITALPTSPSSTSLSRPSSPSMIPRPASPSSLPRVTISKRPVSSTSHSTNPDSSPSTLPKSPPVVPPTSPASFVTPPNKRGGASPSFIPQPVSSPSPMRVMPASASTTKPKATAIPTSTFIRQPNTRKSLFGAKGQSSTASSNSNVPPRNANTHSFHSSSDDDAAAVTLFNGEASNHINSPAQMKSIDFSHNRIFTIQRPTQSQPTRSLPIIPPSPPTSKASIPFVMTTSSPNSVRLSLQTLTNFIPFSWSSRGHSAASDSNSLANGNFDDQNVIGRSQPSAPRKSGEHGFVSREKQLSRLQARIEAEGVVAMRTSTNIECRRCSGQLVCI